MENVLFLSDVLDTKPFRKGAMNIVVAPCGSGKTTAAINRIASLASNSKKALYLIDTRNGCARLSREPKLTLPTLWYDEEIGKKFLIEAPPDDKVVVTTYAQFGIWCQGHQNFTDNFEVIEPVKNLL